MAINIVDVTGKVLSIKKMQGIKNDVVFFDISALPPAAYQVILSTPTEYYTSGFIKTH